MKQTQTKPFCRASALRFLVLTLSVTAFLLPTISIGGTSIIGIDPDYPDVTVYSANVYDANPSPVPLILLLHGYGQAGSAIEIQWLLLDYIETYNFVYAHPTGRLNQFGDRYWDGNDSCCVFPPNHFTLDDVNYLTSLIEEIKSQYLIDDRRVYLAGWSNGGSMAIRMACEKADLVASVVSMGGTGIKDETRCSPSETVEVLTIFGEDDPRIPGGVQSATGLPFPSVIETMRDWALDNRCNDEWWEAPPLNIAAGDGLDFDTSRRIWPIGCDTMRGQNEYWRVGGRPHNVAPFTPEFRTHLLDWLYANTKLPLGFANKDTVEWDAVAGSNQYNVYRSADPSDPYGNCFNGFDPDLTDTDFVDMDVPPSGEFFTYLATYDDSKNSAEAGEGLKLVPPFLVPRARTISAPCP